MTRPSVDTYFMRMAQLVSTRGTCGRRLVGCVLVSAEKHVLATGYNGPPRGAPHCRDTDTACPGKSFAAGQGLDLCEAIHAEQNALLQIGDASKIYTCYCTALPCAACMKLLLNTSCQGVVFAEKYPLPENIRQLWLRAGRKLFRQASDDLFIEWI